jgi:cytochrome c-type biogenesis protein CcsB
MFAFVLLMREALPSRLAAPMPTTQVLELFTYRAIQIGYPLLTWGIFSGAVWADHAWGRFWAWDPKETWSLITWFVYTIFLHMRLRHGLSGRALALASIAGFISVLITWLGVSYLPIFAGLHSYANG